MPGTDERLAAWSPPPRPGDMVLTGLHVRLEPLDPRHSAALHEANRVDDGIWGYLPYGPFGDAAAYGAWVASVAGPNDPKFFAITRAGEPGPSGVASLMRAEPAHGTIEIGHVCFSKRLQQTPAASEAIFLLADWAFAAGYRRLEWKCNAHNAASRRAAERYGFVFEGVFRQHLIVKGANRDTAWFAILDGDWPELAAAHRDWLDAANFDGAGRQRRSLGDLTAPIRLRGEAAHRDP